jgi:hypothetical protein
MPGHKRTGRARVWCSDACRFRAAKARRRARPPDDPDDLLAHVNAQFDDWLATLSAQGA